jgi:hypothetical protein
MKSVRVWLLLLLALLLPVRGAVAAAMLCPIAGSGMQTEMQVQVSAADHAAHEAMHEHKDAHEHAASPVHSADHDHGKAADRCNLCSAFCSLTPLVGGVPTVPTPLDLSSTAFPDFSAPSPSFLSDGQERPPRSI